MSTVKRYGQVIKLKPEMYEKYKELHANVWKEVLAQITACNIRNYTIFHHDGYLFAYFEYVGTDFDQDMKRMANDAKTKEWWELTKPCQQSINTDPTKNWWTNMEELFHHD